MSTDLAVRPPTEAVDAHPIPDPRWQRVTNLLAALTILAAVATVVTARLVDGDAYQWPLIAAFACAAVALRALFEEQR